MRFKSLKIGAGDQLEADGWQGFEYLLVEIETVRKEAKCLNFWLIG